ncbi:hypothetical protein [Sporosarcina obsidiansis]|uniref:hypothetical protein n=1 Tax=Sporosarcina obsidiansis TaxID=2660748 RepID=UPI00129BF47A|nr:hypothetical protein [Sporosarcina obsidiansis]
MSVPLVRRRLPDGSLGPLEPAFPEMTVQMDPAMLILYEAVAGLQEQVVMQQEEIERLKGGAE